MHLIISSPVKDLSPDRYNFCRYLVADPQMNATKAYLKVSPGVKQKTATDVSGRWLREPEVQTYLEELLLARQKRLEIDEDWVVNSLRNIHDKCIQATPVWNGVRYDAAGEEVEPSYYKFDATGAIKSLELMGKHMRMFSDKVDASNISVSVDINFGNDEKPAIEGSFKRVGSD